MVGQLPETMYLYGQESREAVALRHAVYENLFTSLGYEYQAQGLVKLPDLEMEMRGLTVLPCKKGT